MSRDTPRVGGPSSWASDEPSEGPPVVHSHPLPPSVRVILVIYGLMLGIVLGGLFWLVIDGQNRDDKARAAVVAKVEGDLKAAQKAGQKRDAANNEKTRVIVCTVIRESFTPTKNTRALAHQLRCDVPAASPTPTPGTSRGSSQPNPTPRAAPAPRRTSSTPRPKPRPTRRPTPKPTKSCLLPSPLPCTSPQLIPAIPFRHA